MARCKALAGYITPMGFVVGAMVRTTMAKSIEVDKKTLQLRAARAHSLIDLCDPLSRSQNAKPHGAQHHLLLLGEVLVHLASEQRVSC